ncbi:MULTISPECIES: undecaprenyl-diphosphate phosphatase [Paracoccus]|nr:MULTISPECIES: undecaprenyl-diphosphate phosphatase [Paracoccus]MCJ1898852.1 undecaprenyl-diphosphate phosphatase [Paracoccus versutus]MDF3903258.1 undecaprenyl-diphosphate phosphatase [Paracoccus sp. AS002]
MMDHNTLVAAALGLLEGLTEFIPVSSTGHVLLAGHFLGFDSPGRAFEVLIQLGAIMAILGVYSGRLWRIFTSAPHDPRARRFILAVLLAFLPAVVIGVLAHRIIKEVLFETPALIAIMLIVGGVVLLFVDRMATRPRHFSAEDFPLPMALKIGFIQCLAMIPGVSRSGATIVGALLLGADKRSAAEFSFFLSMPTMLGAFVYDLYKNRDILDAAATGNIVLGFVCAFLAAVVVVRGLLNYVSTYGYGFFAWWRIVVGAVVLLALQAG